MMSLKTLLPVLLACALSSCIVVPKVDKKADENEKAQSSCNTFTKPLTLGLAEINGAAMGNVSGPDIIPALLGMFALSGVISGSVMLTCNSAHWLEYQTRCGDGYLRSANEFVFRTASNPLPASAPQASPAQ